MVNVVAALGALFMLAALVGVDPAALRVLGLLTLAVLGLGVVWDALSLLVRRWFAPVVATRRSKLWQVKPRRLEPRGAGRPATLIVDGSNVMHWNGEASQLVLTRVVAKLIENGERPHVYFDANVGYKLAGRYFDDHHMANMLGLPVKRVTVVDKGTPADPVLLDHAVKAGVRVVTNDRFTDWKSQYPQIGSRGFLVKGRWQQGTPILRL
jgi:hypothetical protein